MFPRRELPYSSSSHTADLKCGRVSETTAEMIVHFQYPTGPRQPVLAEYY